MKTFGQFHGTEILDEALVTLGGKAYPKFGNVVFLAAGAGSGKGFVSDKLIALEGITFDVDAVKQKILDVKKYRATLMSVLAKMQKAGEIKEEIPDLENPKVRKKIMKKPYMVSALHQANKELNLSSKIETKVLNAAAMKDPEKLPNLIIDVTMKNFSKMVSWSARLTTAGYKRENIHLVWVVNDVKVAWQQNQSRDRVVPKDIFFDTHKGASRTMADILKMSTGLKKYMDGDIQIVPNARDVNSKYVQGKGKKSGYFAFADKFIIKKKGGIVDMSKMSKELEAEIKKKVPEGTFDLDS